MKFLMNIIYSCVNQRNYNVDFFFFSLGLSAIWCLVYLLCATETASMLPLMLLLLLLIHNSYLTLMYVHGFCREKNQQFILILLCFHFLEKKEKLCKNRKNAQNFGFFKICKHNEFCVNKMKQIKLHYCFECRGSLKHTRWLPKKYFVIKYEFDGFCNQI